MVRDFGYKDPSTISVMVTLIISSFSLGGAASGVLWGRFSDIRGRKASLLLGLLGTAVSTLSFGLSKNIYMAILSRGLAGLLNGNNAVMKTTIAEIIGDRKEYQSRAFAIIPMTFNIGNILGPMIGGLLADPVANYPSRFGNSKLFTTFPYLLPNLVVLSILALAFVLTVLFIEETGNSPKAYFPTSKDVGLQLGDKIRTAMFIPVPEHHRPLPSITVTDDSESESVSELDNTPYMTEAVKMTLLCYVILMVHAPAFLQLFSLFLSTPRSPTPLGGGLGWPSSKIGFLMSTLGVTGIVIQLAIYPSVSNFFGNAKVHKLSLYLFPAAYFTVPFLTSMPDVVAVASGATVVLARCFALPPMSILLTNAAPSRRVLGTINGIAQSATAVSKCVAPFVLGNLYSLGVKIEMVGLAWWAMAAIVVVEIWVARGLREWSEWDKEPELVTENQPLLRDSERVVEYTRSERGIKTN